MNILETAKQEKGIPWVPLFSSCLYFFQETTFFWGSQNMGSQVPFHSYCRVQNLKLPLLLGKFLWNFIWQCYFLFYLWPLEGKFFDFSLVRGWLDHKWRRKNKLETKFFVQIILIWIFLYGCACCVTRIWHIFEWVLFYALANLVCLIFDWGVSCIVLVLICLLSIRLLGRVFLLQFHVGVFLLGLSFQTDLDLQTSFGLGLLESRPRTSNIAFSPTLEKPRNALCHASLFLCWYARSLFFFKPHSYS